MLVLHHLQRLYGHAGGQGEATEGAAVLARLDVEHDVVVGQAGRDGQYAAAQGFS